MKLSRWLTALSVLIFFLLVVGGMVRNLGAGLSCPDWPLCQGHLIPQFNLRVFAEYFHRLFAATVSILTLVLAFVVFSNKRLKKLLGKFMIAALLLLLSQVILGGLTVLQLLQSQIVTLHLATGSLFFATIIFMTLKTLHEPTNSQSHPPSSTTVTAPDTDTATDTDSTPWSPLFAWGQTTLLILYLQMILGGEVSSHYAGLACPDFPKCLGQWFPGFAGLQGIHFVHRLGACIAFTVILIYVCRILLTKGLPETIRWKGRGIFVFLLLQVSLGIGNVVFRLPLAVSVGHLAVAELLLALLIITNYEIRSFQLRQSH